MRPILALAAGLIVTVGLSAVVMANPSMLPKHEGYPMGKSTDPVSGKPLSTDSGQTNAGGEKALQKSATANDAHIRQQLSNQDNQRILDKPGAGILPKVQGPQIRIEPPVKEASRTPANPQ